MYHVQCTNYYGEDENLVILRLKKANMNLYIVQRKFF
jgi:hypothetical protein